MKFYYNLVKFLNHEDPDEYYTEDEVRAVKLYPATSEVVEMAKDMNSHLWPVHDPHALSMELVECENEEQAREYILMSANESVYSYIMGI